MGQGFRVDFQQSKGCLGGVFAGGILLMGRSFQQILRNLGGAGSFIFWREGLTLGGFFLEADEILNLSRILHV